MKRRIDYIIEKVNFHDENQLEIDDNTIEASPNIPDNGVFTADCDKENAQPVNKSLREECVDKLPTKNIIIQGYAASGSKSLTNSPSIIENSPDRSIPYIDPKVLSTAIDQAHTITKVEEFSIFLEPVPNDYPQSTISTRKSSSPSSDTTSSSLSRSSSSSSSSDSSSSSTNASKDTSNTYLPIDGPSTSNRAARISSQNKKNYHQSPINSNESDVDISDSDPTYTVIRPQSRRSIHVSRSNSNSSSSDSNTLLTDNTTKRQSRKRIRNPAKWKQNVAKALRNTGKAYVSVTTKKEVPARAMKSPCKCKLKCGENVVDADRKLLFEKYWSLGNVEIQRSYIRSCMVTIQPKYKYTNAAKPRLPNNAFYFTINTNKIRVCKTFFINTLGICDRQIRTIKKKSDEHGFLNTDIRGKHVSRKPIDPLLIEEIKQHINSIPRVESHYLRATTSREYISGEKTIMDIWKDFNKCQEEKSKSTCQYWVYYDVFTKQFNISFFQPKKDRCDLCLDYELATPDRKSAIKDKYEQHIKEKDLCREEKRNDRKNIDNCNICTVYDLEAVMQCPSGETSSFFYKSKLNCLNFTIVEMSKKSEENKKRKRNEEDEIGAYSNVYNYFWDEVQGHRGANEIGSCILEYLERLNEHAGSEEIKLHITFYSDNCCGQNKNKYIVSLYSYAVTHLKNIESITHKFLIKGHTQNEGDNVHSLIEKEIKRNKKAGPIYAPSQYVTLIKNAKKNGKPFTVKELTYDFFIDMKDLQEKCGYNFNEDEDKNTISFNDIKILYFCKREPFVFYFKTSYSQTEYKKVNMRNKRKKMINPGEVTTTKLFTQKLELSERKKKDLRVLINKNLIPNYYVPFYNTIL